MNGIKNIISDFRNLLQPQTSQSSPAPISPLDIRRYKTLLGVLLDGLYDEESNLFKLRGCHQILKAIWHYTREYNLQEVNKSGYSDWIGSLMILTIPTRHYPAFPNPRGLNVNMMPFICGECFDDYQLPKYIKPYKGLIKLCMDHQMNVNFGLVGKICYLTIQEGEVASGQSQRRPGLHVDTPGRIKIKHIQEKKDRNLEEGSWKRIRNQTSRPQSGNSQDENKFDSKMKRRMIYGGGKYQDTLTSLDSIGSSLGLISRIS